MNEHRFRLKPNAGDVVESAVSRNGGGRGVSRNTTQFAEELSQLVQLADENGIEQYEIQRVLERHLNDLDNLCGDDGS
jgi:uncharacterized protein YidB (DUF937 family)